MTAIASVTTAKSPAAIAMVEVFGDSAAKVVAQIFKTASGRDCPFKQGAIYTGDIVDEGRIIDNIVAARTGEKSIEISCHGNPLIIEMIMTLLKKQGAQLVSAEKLIAEKLTAKGIKNSIEQEKEIEKLKAVSLTGIKAITDSNLSTVAATWLENFDSLKIEDIRSQSEEILAASRSAKYLITGCKAVIAGPPNSGKSTLLNSLCGRQKAIVTDVAGTTRDWVSATLKIGEIAVEIFDTAGLDAAIVGTNAVDAESQKRSIKLLSSCDIVLLVLDSSNTVNGFDFSKITESGKKVIAVLNKSDITDTSKFNLNFEPDETVNISALTGEGIEQLSSKMQKLLASERGEHKVICFTDRQVSILKRLASTNESNEIKELILELVNGKVY